MVSSRRKKKCRLKRLQERLRSPSHKQQSSAEPPPVHRTVSRIRVLLSWPCQLTVFPLSRSDLPPRNPCQGSDLPLACCHCRPLPFQHLRLKPFPLSRSGPVRHKLCPNPNRTRFSRCCRPPSLREPCYVAWIVCTHKWVIGL